MSYRKGTSISYEVNVNIGGLGLALVAIFGGGRSVHELLMGTGEWGPSPSAPWLELESGSGNGLFGSFLPLGQSVESSNGEWVT